MRPLFFMAFYNMQWSSRSSPTHARLLLNPYLIVLTMFWQKISWNSFFLTNAWRTNQPTDRPTNQQTLLSLTHLKINFLSIFLLIGGKYLRKLSNNDGHYNFLDASLHLYKSDLPSVRPSVGPSIGPSVTLL